MNNKYFIDTHFDIIPDSPQRYYYICVNTKNVVKYYSLYVFNSILPHTVKCLIPFEEPIATVEIIPDKYHKISKMKVVFGHDDTWHLTEKDIRCIYYEQEI